MRWSFPMTHFVTGELLAEHVPFSDVRFSDTLDNGGVFSARFPVEEIGKRFSLQVKEDLWRCMVWPCRYGVPVGAYVLTSLPDESLSSPTVSVGGQRWDAVLSRREVYHDLNFIGRDQLNIARDLIRYAVGLATHHTEGSIVDPAVQYKGLPWLRFGLNLSGVVRTVVVSTASGADPGFDGKSGKTVADMLKQLSEIGDDEDADPGFEYRADYGIDTDTGELWARMTLDSPTVGRTRFDKNRIVFEYPGKAVVKASYGADGQEFATRVRALGRERDGQKPSFSVLNQSMLDAGYPLLDSNFTVDAVLPPTLAARARARRRRSKVTSGWSLTLDGTKDPQFGTYRTGDNVILRSSRLGVRLPDVALRVTGWDVQVVNDQESVTPQLAEV